MKNTKGAYSSPYNYIYHYLLDNFEPEMDLTPAHELLFRELKAFCIKDAAKLSDGEIKDTVKQAIDAFKNNNGEHGDTAHNLGKKHANSIDTIKSSLEDLRW